MKAALSVFRPSALSVDRSSALSFLNEMTRLSFDFTGHMADSPSGPQLSVNAS
jgi:hypothetical protein